MDNQSQCTKLVLTFDPTEDEADVNYVNYVTFSFVKVSQLTLLSVICEVDMS